MFKLVIADDEIRIREGFLHIVDWETLGFRVVGCYSDGSEVLKHLEQEHVDVVLTDIKMKVTGGLEVARVIHEHYPNTVCVLVSAYQEFDYAHQAIALGVKDYLPKPTRLGDIRKVFSAIAQELEKEGELLEKQDKHRRNYEEMSALWRSQFFYVLYMGTLRKEEIIQKQAQHYYPSITQAAVLLRQYSITWPSGVQTLSQEELQDILRRLFQGKKDHLAYDLVSSTLTSLAIMVVVDKGQLLEDEKQLTQHLEGLIKQAKEMVGVIIKLESSQHYESLMAFAARTKYQLQTSPGAGEVVLNPESAQMFLSQQRLLLSYLTSGEEENLYLLAKEMINQLLPLPSGMVKTLLIDTVARLHARLQEMDMTKPVLPRYDLLITAQNGEAISKWFCNQLDLWRAEMPLKNTPGQIVGLLKNYIQANYE